jgi:uroporphyrinogen-III synthase
VSDSLLNGAHILVTRPQHQADKLCQLIEGQGGVPVRFPTLEILGLDQGKDATNPNLKLSKFQWLIFTSANAVNFALAANNGKISQLRSAQIAAIGKATAKALESAGLQVSLLPEQGYDSEALLAMPQMQDVNNQGVLIIRGRGGREELADGLRNRGANVEYWEVYKRIMPDVDCSGLIGMLEQGLLDVIVITSGEALQNLVVMLGKNYKDNLALIPLVVISERISRLAAELGFKRIAVTECPSDMAILDTAIAIVDERDK